MCRCPVRLIGLRIRPRLKNGQLILSRIQFLQDIETHSAAIGSARLYERRYQRAKFSQTRDGNLNVAYTVNLRTSRARWPNGTNRESLKDAALRRRALDVF